MSDQQIYIGQATPNQGTTTQTSTVQKKDNGKTILLCEDDPLLQTMYKTKFEKDGFHVLVAHDGEECITLSLQYHPDCLICDIMLPKLSGLDAIKKIREDSWGKTLPVIVLSNLMNQTEKNIIATLQVKAFLLKSDVTPKQVAEIVYTYISA
jgi:CheY-like chemotaxis protein